MALQSSGAISLDDLHVEVGGTSGTTCSLNDPDIRALINVGDSAGQSIQQYYGVSSEVGLPTGGSTVNGQVQLKEITASTYISAGGTLRIPSSMWVWSDNTSVAALTIDISCTIINDGKVIGKGGTGGYGNYPGGGYNASGNGNGQDGGPAIKINSGVSGVTITNSSGAFIAGGGGGGGASGVEPMNTYSGGGGGAGGGVGGQGGGVGLQPGGTGGALNAQGTQPTTYATGGYGGDAGGGGVRSGNEDGRSGAGGGGGRILPGAASYSPNTAHIQGGGAGNAGSNGGAGGYGGASGGGGGWGAAGGRGYRGAFTGIQCQGGAGGKAVEDSGNSYTLSNSGTIYGATT